LAKKRGKSGGGGVSRLSIGPRRHERVFLTLRLYHPFSALLESADGVREALLPRILKKSVGSRL
jgi:hypothetical protein